MKAFYFFLTFLLLSLIDLSSCCSINNINQTGNDIEIDDYNFFNFYSSFPNDVFKLDDCSAVYFNTVTFYSNNPYVANVSNSTLYTYAPGHAEIELRNKIDFKCLGKIIVNVYGGFELTLDEENDGYIITGYDQNVNFNQHEFVFPETYLGIPLIGINNGIFNMSYGPEATVLVLPGSIKAIMDNTFNGSKYLNTLILKNGIERIESYAFGHCSSLTNVIIPESVHYMGANVFYDSSSELKIFCEATQKPSTWDDTFSGNGKVYWYSENEPSSNGFWRYVDGKPVIW